MIMIHDPIMYLLIVVVVVIVVVLVVVIVVVVAGFPRGSPPLVGNNAHINNTSHNH